MNFIKELHLHDANTSNDHLKFGKGQMSLKQITKFLTQYKILAPIILEINLENLYKEGKK